MYFCPWKPENGISPTLQRKCQVGENAVLGLSIPELVRNACFYIDLVIVTSGMAKDFDLQIRVIYVLLKLTIWVAGTRWQSSYKLLALSLAILV